MHDVANLGLSEVQRLSSYDSLRLEAAQRTLSVVKIEANGWILPEISINTYTKRGVSSANAAVEANNAKQSILTNGDSLTLLLPRYAHRAQIDTSHCTLMADEHLIVHISLCTSKAIRYYTTFT